jgi:TIR domain/SIR2-like domain
MIDSSQGYSIFWRQLLSRMKDGQVIPIVGQDAILVQDEGKPITLNAYVARRVESLLDLGRVDTAEPHTLHEVACRYLEQTGGGDLADVYWAVKEALSERPVEVPEALRKLARIDAFNLYVTTTFDDLLRRALDLERFEGQPCTASYAYSPGRVEDLPVPVSKLTGPTVYHLLGRVSSVQDYVVTEEDTLEFVHSLQSENRSPTLLMDEFRSRSILVIGSGYSDWLMRFILRIAKRERLLFARSKTDMVVDPRGDPSLKNFLQHFSAQIKVFTGGTTAFIDELGSRWEEFRVQDTPPSRAADQRIFVSYASEDRERARRLAEGLSRAGLPVWFDKPRDVDDMGGLKGGMAWEHEIMSQINDACMFAAVLSRNVQTPEKRYFRKEWEVALEAGKRVPANQRFIVPVRVDDLPPDAPELPARFRELQWLDLGEGEDFTRTVQCIRDIYRTYRRARSPAA